MVMRVEIFSMMAAVGGVPKGTTWAGYIDPIEGESDEQLLERIYRLFNRVEDWDYARLEEIGYRLPSLSAGDYVTLHSKEVRTWRVAGVGFELVTGNRDFLTRVLS